MIRQKITVVWCGGGDRVMKKRTLMILRGRLLLAIFFFWFPDQTHAVTTTIAIAITFSKLRRQCRGRRRRRRRRRSGLDFTNFCPFYIAQYPLFFSFSFFNIRPTCDFLNSFGLSIIFLFSFFSLVSSDRRFEILVFCP